ncbi:2-C-methyl-D-erythritol 4-phosphate cytidylyltransferase [Sphaerisporangium sp. TRM90804]|uniref:IspD/TarI family cytidylyltransferase n=1 Tax=Sphaerisporangium sp. TRM90804 TaxID=3031113 RepID=UPI00244A876E|nr:2-C-methyl-D-erythritol 4-phosphate cytidylyltransferase [Sphaerisporangium sp. TRM90804]MDH2424603.1 2-C-methyl-D-erythritol 4-phosphate cytidylyltransferase [Sphaerisporangium sp. TRM90804]
MAHHVDHVSVQPSTGGVTAIILGAGQGERLGQGPKAALELRGRPLLWWILRSVLTNVTVDEVVLVVPESVLATARAVVGAFPDRLVMKVVLGGATRQESAWLGIQAGRRHSPYVAIAEAARPLTPAGVIDELVGRLATEQGHLAGALPGIPMFDTMRRAETTGRSLGTVNRSELVACQTPQVVCRRCFADAYHLAREKGLQITDDAGLVELEGGDIQIVEGDPTNIKVTVERDLRMVEAFMAVMPSGSTPE